MGYEHGYAGRDAEPLNYTITDMVEYRDGWLAGVDQAELDKIRRELGEQA